MQKSKRQKLCLGVKKGIEKKRMEMEMKRGEKFGGLLFWKAKILSTSSKEQRLYELVLIGSHRQDLNRIVYMHFRFCLKLEK